MFEYQSANGGTSGGDRTPILKFSAKDGSFILADRENVDGQWSTRETELDMPAKVVMDMAEVEQGWMAFKPAPDFVMVKNNQPRPERPNEVDANGLPLYKWGFRVKLANKEMGLRELSSSSKNVYARMKSIALQFEAGKAENAGKVPVVTIDGTERVTQTLSDGQTQTWRVPKWSITGWVDRPAVLDGATENAPVAAAAPVIEPAPAAPVEGSDLF
jgi:hypothetical protein